MPATAKAPAAPQGPATSSEPVALARIDARIFPDVVDVPLWPHQVTHPLERLSPMWHSVPRYPSAVVSVTSNDDTVRLLHLTVEGGEPGWSNTWVRWSFAARTLPDIMGGDAVAAQDVLADDDSSLTLLLLPGETREAILEVTAHLDGTTRPGTYTFDVVTTDAHDGSRDALTAQVRLDHPDSRYMDMLPSIFTEAMGELRERAETPDRPFFERYLRGFDDATEPMHELLDNLHRLFDANETAPDFVPWLATWVDMALDENWPEMKRRQLIREAVELYRWRGTRRGLSRYLQIYADVVPEINDQPFRGMRLGPQTLLGDAGTVLGDVPPHTFVVTVSVPDPRSINEQIVRDIVEAQRPAHTSYVIRIVRRASGEE